MLLNSPRLYNGVRLIDHPSPMNISRIDRGAAPMIVRMMQRGFAVDRDALRDLSSYLGSECSRIETEIAALVGRPVKPGSHPDVRKLLFHELKVQSGMGRTLKTTPSGLESTGKLEIEPYLAKHPVVGMILRHRQMDKLKGTYADAMLGWARWDSSTRTWRVHTTFKQTSVNGGRLASEDPNLQNIPTRTPEGRRIKNCFIASPGKLIVDCDFSQIHMRVAAHLSKARFMSDVFHSGGDIHTNNAMKVYSIARPEDVTEDLRYPMKRTGFGILYLITAVGLNRQLNASDAQNPERMTVWTEDECRLVETGELIGPGTQSLIDGYYDVNPEIRDFQELQFQRARRYGMTWDMFGRIRPVPEAKSALSWITDAGLRQAANLPMIGGEVGLMKLAMAMLWDMFESDGLRDAAGIEELVQVHDSLVVEVNEEYAEEVGRVMKATMESVCRLDVPIKADVKIGYRTAESKGESRWGSVTKLKMAA